MPTHYSRFLCKIIPYDSSKKVHTEIYVKLLAVVDLVLGGASDDLIILSQPW